MSTPVISSVNGSAAGVGLAVACFADLRFGLASAKLTTAAPKLGLPAEYGLSWLLPRLVGAGHAADLLLSGRVVLGRDAAVMGLLNAAFDTRSELDTHVFEYATNLAHHVAPSSIAVTKAQLWHDVTHHDVAGSVRRSRELLDEMIPSDDFREGTAALRERRPPQFEGSADPSSSSATFPPE